MDFFIERRKQRELGVPDEPYTVNVSSWTCVHCNLTLNGAVTPQLGARRCWWHPGTSGQFGRYSCCGYSALFQAGGVDLSLRAAISALEKGCTRCDHLPTLVWDLAVSEEFKLVVPSHVIGAWSRSAVPQSDATFLQRWTARQCNDSTSLLQYLRYFSRCDTAYHATLSPEVLKLAAAKMAQRKQRMLESSAAAYTQSVSWLPYQPLPEATPPPSTETRAQSAKNEYLAQLLVAPRDSKLMGKSASSYTADEIALGDALKPHCTPPLTVIRVTDTTPTVTLFKSFS